MWRFHEKTNASKAVIKLNAMNAKEQRWVTDVERGERRAQEENRCGRKARISATGVHRNKTRWVMSNLGKLTLVYLHSSRVVNIFFRAGRTVPSFLYSEIQISFVRLHLSANVENKRFVIRYARILIILQVSLIKITNTSKTHW